MSLTKLYLAGREKLYYSRPGKVCLAASRLGTGKTANLLLQCTSFADQSDFSPDCPIPYTSNRFLAIYDNPRSNLPQKIFFQCRVQAYWMSFLKYILPNSALKYSLNTRHSMIVLSHGFSPTPSHIHFYVKIQKHLKLNGLWIDTVGTPASVQLLALPVHPPVTRNLMMH